MRSTPGYAQHMSPAAHAGRQLTPLEPLVERLEGAEAVDPLAEGIARRVREAIPDGAVKDVLSGTWLGHALHPILTDVVIGSFVSASMLDLLGGDDDGKAAERLIAIGIAAYGPTALTGASDWADSEPADDGIRRVGIVHAGANAVALSLYSASLIARRRGARRTGVLLGVAGATALGAAGYLGGHLTFAQGVGPDQTVFDRGPAEWTEAGDASELADGDPTRLVVDDTPVLALRDGSRVRAIHDRCSHRGCSLTEGEIDGDEVQCACHGSRFNLEDGSVTRGPATLPQPAFEVREQDGRIEMRLRRS